MSGALGGLLVADFSRVLAGPLAATTLADLGATVVKVERPDVGDDTRHWGPPWTPRASSYFECANRTKLSLELDFLDPDDLDAAIELAHRADIVIENFKDGTLERFGLGYDQVAIANPGVIYASITGFGRAGGRHLSGYDFLLQAVGGLMSITGEPDRPTKAGVALIDVLTAKDATVGILAALHARGANGRGQRVEVNLLSSLLGSLANQASSYLATGEVPPATGNRHPSIAPYETLSVGDVPIAVCCGNDRQFAVLSQVLGTPDLATDHRFVTNAKRVENRDALVIALESALEQDTAESWVRRLTSAGIAAGRVGTIADAFALANRLGLDPTVDVGHDFTPQVRSPLRLSETPVDGYFPPPALGEHNQAVRQWLAEERKLPIVRP